MKHPRKAGKGSRQERRAARRAKTPPRALVIVRNQEPNKVRRFHFKEAGNYYVVTWSNGRIVRVSREDRATAVQYKQVPEALVERVRATINQAR